MKTWLAVIFSVILMIVCLGLSSVLKVNLIPWMIIITASWAAWDSSKIELKKYKSGISYGPVVVWICHAGLWIVAFPWYLSMRYKIKNGLAQLKEQSSK